MKKENEGHMKKETASIEDLKEQHSNWEALSSSAQSSLLAGIPSAAEAAEVVEALEIPTPANIRVNNTMGEGNPNSGFTQSEPSLAVSPDPDGDIVSG
jgi:hypothetical protein